MNNFMFVGENCSYLFVLIIVLGDDVVRVSYEKSWMPLY
jgi:hypothetical protein